ncbi:uncharacterized protein LOC112087697 [Eutrema salsugineum]|uniref:uncharacterized protein LOC112087697 n=1 Tax=Eutrema salsugineum TaxID=72664 RepID=UPI000CED2780|nr:uncharacterized protein LOC112087697 [Eutrema salsugineum]
MDVARQSTISYQETELHPVSEKGPSENMESQISGGGTSEPRSCDKEELCTEDEQPFFLVESRVPLWNELRQINDSTPAASYPWAVVGDFNQMMRVSHHSNHLAIDVDTSGMEEFNLALQDAELFEAQAKGLPFTWKNNQADPISTKIDHAFINHAWSSSFPESFAEFLEPLQSDHTPCLVRIPSLQRRNRKPFKFFHHVIDHPSFTDVVKGAWNCDSVIGSDQFKLVRVMKGLK